MYALGPIQLFTKNFLGCETFLFYLRQWYFFNFRFPSTNETGKNISNFYSLQPFQLLSMLSCNSRYQIFSSLPDHIDCIVSSLDLDALFLFLHMHIAFPMRRCSGPSYYDFWTTLPLLLANSQDMECIGTRTYNASVVQIFLCPDSCCSTSDHNILISPLQHWCF